MARQGARPVADTRPHVTPRSRQEWRRWLEAHHASASAVWLLFAKKHSGLPSPTYNDAVEEALCENRRAPGRPPTSNKARVTRLLDQGLMTAAGLNAIAAAKQNGNWTTLDAAEAQEMPGDLRQALDANTAARRHWPLFTDSQQTKTRATTKATRATKKKVATKGTKNTKGPRSRS